MRERIRNWAAVVIAGLCLALAVPGLLAPDVAFTGIELRLDGSELVVASVDPASRVYGTIQPGTVVHDVNFTLPKDIPEKTIDAYLRGDFLELGIPDQSGGWTQWTFPPEAGAPVEFLFIVGIGLLFGAAIWVGRGQAGEALRPLAIPIAAASSAPLILLPATTGFSWTTAVGWSGLVGAGLLSIGAVVVLADGFVERVSPQRRRRLAAAIAWTAAATCVATQTGLMTVMGSGATSPLVGVLILMQLVLFPVITLAPAVILVSGGRVEMAANRPDGTRWSDRLPVLLAAMTPIVIAFTVGYAQTGLGLSIPLIWLLVVVVVLQTNARIETMRIQRDTVVAATEVERARLAADLHDDALQEMTVLVRRLDEAGDATSATLARSIADRLREVCGELRLPVLDELGAGPALEWLVERVGEASGEQVRLVREDAGRPPAHVELAVFRVAQEALSNAVTHGEPPIVVRYAAAPDRASLSITDHGSGIAADAATTASRSGHYGLLNMRQRAEQIGGTIDVRRPPDGGTTVGLSWSST